MELIYYEAVLGQKLKHDLEVFMTIYNDWVDMMNEYYPVGGPLSKIESLQVAFNHVCYGYGLSNIVNVTHDFKMSTDKEKTQHELGLQTNSSGLK